MRAWSESNTLISRQVWPRFTRESNSRRHQMRKYLIGLIVIAGAMAITITEADARRLGGGGSFGRQSQGITRQQAPAPPSQATRSAAPPAAAPAPPKRLASASVIVIAIAPAITIKPIRNFLI